MKKILILLLACFILTACNKTVDYTVAQYTDITYDEFMEKIDNGESFVVLLYQTGCTHCESFEPKLNKVILDYDVQIYALNLADLSDEEYSKVENKTFVSGTPTTVSFKDGKKDSRLVGDQSESDIIEFLQDAGYIEEG